MNLSANPCRFRHPGFAWLLSLVLMAAAMVSCRAAKETGEPVELRFADYLGPQQSQVTTRVVLPDREREGDRLGYGWAVKKPKDLKETVLEMRRETARIRFFSVDTDTRGLEIEAYWSGRTAAAAPNLALRLNGRRLADLEVGDDWKSHRIDIPEGIVRSGLNVVEFERGAETSPPRRKRRFARFLRLRHLSLLTGDDQPLGSEQPPRITLLDGSPGAPGRPVIQMPTDSYLDLVAELPGRSRLIGHYTVEFPVDGAGERVTLYVELLDAKGRTRELMVEKLSGPTEKPQRLVANLDRWSGELVRLRLGIAGPGLALVQWHDPRIVGRGGAGTKKLEGGEAAIAPPRSGRLGRPDVVFILLDAARADAFSCFGGPYPTPALERLAKEGTIFNRALAPSSWTGQSVPAIFTGLFPDTLGIEHWGSRLPPGVPTLAALLREAGHHTLLWSQHPFYRWRQDLKGGFGEAPLLSEHDGDIADLRRRLAETPEPTFAFVHLMPPHLPYEPPSPYRGLHSSWYQGEIQLEVEFLNDFPYRRSPEDLDPADLRYIKDRYLEHAAFADSQVAEVQAILEELGRYDEALIVVLADHGEAFLEHGYFLHSQNVYEEQLHVPLLVKWPQGVVGFPSTIGQPVSLVDLVPTLVDGLDLSTARGFQGISLLPMVFGEDTARRSLYATTRGVDRGKLPPNTIAMLQLDGWKLIHNKINFENELYNLTEDPGERHDLADEMPTRVLLLYQEIQRRIWLNEGFLETGGGEVDLETLDKEEIEQLRALGYLN